MPAGSKKSLKKWWKADRTAAEVVVTIHNAADPGITFQRIPGVDDDPVRDVEACVDRMYTGKATR